MRQQGWESQGSWADIDKFTTHAALTVQGKEEENKKMLVTKSKYWTAVW